MRHAWTLGWVLACAACVSSGPGPGPRCRMSGVTLSWLEGSLASWEVVRSRQLRLPPAPTPQLVVFDRFCVYSFERGGTGSLRLRAEADTLRGDGQAHGDTIDLPNGLRIPVRGEAFASLLPGDSATFLVMALEDVWRADPTHGGAREDWPSYLRRSFVHEMTHARQLVTWAPMLRIAATQLGLGDFDDDIIQQRFDSVPEFRRAIAEETALLYGAAAAASTTQQRVLAQRALDRVRQRRARVYGGVDSPWARVEQLLLDMEGVAQWAAMAHVANSARLGLNARRNLVRGTRQYWSQDQGLALYMVLDALVPGWQAHVFSPDPPSSLELLERSLAR